MSTRSHPFVQLPLNKMMLPQGVLPTPPPSSNTPANPAAAPPDVRLLLGACFNSWQRGHFDRDCPTREKARKPAVLAKSEAVKTTAEEINELIAEKCSGVRFCVNFSLVHHVASQ